MVTPLSKYVEENTKEGVFELTSNFSPCGDQPDAIADLVHGLEVDDKYQTLLGVTGSGKTFTIANVIEKVQRPTLVISPNKTLCSQLQQEFEGFFQNNFSHYFVSAFDFYLPEAFIPITERFIKKRALTNTDILFMKHSAAAQLMVRKDVIVTASVSCIFPFGNALEFRKQMMYLEVGKEINRNEFLQSLIKVHYERNDVSPEPGEFRVRGDVIDFYPMYEENMFKIEFWGDEIDRITEVNPVTQEPINQLKELVIFAADHFVTSGDTFDRAIKGIEEELNERVEYFKERDMFIEANRISERTRYDLELLRQHGRCSGIEHYARYFLGLEPGENGHTLLDYFPEDLLVVIDESHITIPQLQAMYKGSYSRVKTLVDHGWRLPSALDNRPLTFDEFVSKVKNFIFVSATPGPFELEYSSQVTEQLIRPTGLVDPKVTVHPRDGQVDHLLTKVRERIDKKQRVIITTLTKQSAEDLTIYLNNININACYMHGDLDLIERQKIIQEFREGIHDVIVGINLLREGLDFPEVSLVAILDADQKGFLRNATSLIQVIGRTARNVDGEALLYGNTITDAMDIAISETNRRRQIQMEYNEENNITPRSISSIHI